MFWCTRVIGLGAAVLLLSGCSELRIEDGGCKNVGIRYYEPAFFLKLSVTKTPADDSTTPPTLAKTTWNSELITLPDLSEPRYIKPVYRLGSLDWTVTLKDGWQFGAANAKADPKVPETLAALASLASAVSPVGVVGDDPPQEPLLWRVREKGGAIYLEKVEVRLGTPPSDDDDSASN